MAAEDGRVAVEARVEHDGSREHMYIEVPSTPPSEEALLGILLSFSGQRPREHWLHSSACFGSALEALMNEP